MVGKTKGIQLFGFQLSKKELKEVVNPKKLFIAALGAVFVNFVILAPFQLPWEGWNTVISTVTGMIFAEWLD